MPKRGEFFTLLFQLIRLKNSLLFFAFILFSYSFYACGLDQRTEGNDQNQNQVDVSTDFNLVAAGDFGCTEDAKKTIEAMERQDPELLIALGDLTESKSPDCWFDMITSLKNVSNLKITFGWHDVSIGENIYNQYLQFFNLSRPYYSFDYSNIHFIARATAKIKKYHTTILLNSINS